MYSEINNKAARLVGGNGIAIPSLFLDEQLWHSLVHRFLHSANGYSFIIRLIYRIIIRPRELRIAHSTTDVIAKIFPQTILPCVSSPLDRQFGRCCKSAAPSIPSLRTVDLSPTRSPPPQPPFLCENSSYYYRSLEVLLGYQYTTDIDMWSFGCIVAELFLELPLFPGASEFDLLRRMIEILGVKTTGLSFKWEMVLFLELVISRIYEVEPEKSETCKRL
ncbi:hypothetical protein ES288_A06G157400v1 [Gossypium darwinii]|uniref:Protein kinase domain-containing protein n=1 Tax=Gossypium darwinii TaxID=34276 RepID=A0A5D2G7K3_GOSDA|nr:hypothetical protein ES288_A06G157400v1 [Gossypium darwinii]